MRTSVSQSHYVVFPDVKVSLWSKYELLFQMLHLSYLVLHFQILIFVADNIRYKTSLPSMIRRILGHVSPLLLDSLAIVL
jgi:hypothetical protein